MSSAPTVNGTTVNFKIVVANDKNNCGPKYLVYLNTEAGISENYCATHLRFT
jgi:hypothetical protein